MIFDMSDTLNPTDLLCSIDKRNFAKIHALFCRNALIGFLIYPVPIMFGKQLAKLID